MFAVNSQEFIHENLEQIQAIASAKLAEINPVLLQQGFYSSTVLFPEAPGVGFAAMIYLGQHLDESGWTVDLRWRLEEEGIACDLNVSIALDVKF